MSFSAGRRVFAAVLSALFLACGPAAAQGETQVDLELVLAVDVSLSMDVDEQTVQRNGYASALIDPLVLDAIAQGAHQRIAVAYVEWAGEKDQKKIVDWKVIDGKASAEAFVAELKEQPLQRWRRTSVSEALVFSAKQFEGNGITGRRRVIDVSGDGANNQGRPVLDARKTVLAQGITINGLPLLLKRQSPYSVFDVQNLDVFYADCVIGGPSAFMIPVRSVGEFREAIRNKLVLEIAGYAPPQPLVHFAAAEETRPPCDVGERQWRNWMRDGYQ